MRHIKGLRVFESIQDLNQEQIDFLDDCTERIWTINPSTGLVDIKGNFICSKFKIRLDSFKGVNFGLVTDNFKCQSNSLTTLEGAPKEVGESFYCSFNSLTSLEGAPRKVGRSFFCYDNSLTSLKGSPEVVVEDFYSGDNSLTSLEGAPEKIGGDFDCSDNSLTSLEGAPQEVGENFNCSYNSFTSLKGAPEKVGGFFYCDEFMLGKGEWNSQGWLKILKVGNEKAKKLILTLPFFDPVYLQNEIDKNPGKWVIELKGVWNLEEFKPVRDQLKVSDQFLKDIGGQSTLSDLGF